MSRTVEVVAERDAAGSNDDFAAVLKQKYRAAVSGLLAQIEFGALLARKRDELAATDSALNRPGGGLKGWLKAHAPEIHIGTAYRFMHCAEAAASVAKLRGTGDVALLLGASLESLTMAQLRQRKKLEKTAIEAGTQRQLLMALGTGEGQAAKAPAAGNALFLEWMRKFHPDVPAKKLGDLPKADQAAFRTWERKEIEKRANELEAGAPKEDARKFWTRWVAEGMREGFGKKHSWAALVEQERTAVADFCADLAKAIRAAAGK